MFNKIRKIDLLPDFIIKAEFSGGVQKLYDMKPLFEKYEAFKPLKDIPGLFARGKVDCGGYGVAWTDDIDIDSGEIWYNGKCILKTDDDIRQYIKTVAEEADPEYIIKAVNDVAKVKGFQTLAEQAGVSRESLYKSLNGKTKPRFETIYKLLMALGVRLTVKTAN